MEIQVIIQYQDDILYLEGIPQEKRSEYIRNAVTIGLRSIQMSELTMDGRSYLDPLKEIMDNHGLKVDGLSEILDKLMTVRENSTRKGKLAENICIGVLEERYPSTEFRDTAKRPHSGDCRGIFTIGEVMYEFKDYDKAVNTAEIQKFHSDLQTTGIKFGIFVSNCSAIAGKKHTIEWSIVGHDTIAVYVSRLGFSGLGCIVGTEFLLALQKAMILDAEKGWLMRNDIQFTGYQERFSDCVDEYRSHQEQVSRLGNTIQEVQKKVQSSFEPLHKQAMVLKLDMETTFRKMVGLRDDIVENRELSYDVFDASEFLERCDNPKFKSLYETLLKMCDLEPTLQLRCNDKNLSGYMDDELRFRTTSTQSKVTIVFPLTGEHVNLNINYETLKDTSVLIEVKDETPIWEIIRSRLAAN